MCVCDRVPLVSCCKVAFVCASGCGEGVPFVRGVCVCHLVCVRVRVSLHVVAEQALQLGLLWGPVFLNLCART